MQILYSIRFLQNVEHLQLKERNVGRNLTLFWQWT